MEMHDGCICIDTTPSLQKTFLEVGLKLFYLVSALVYFWCGILLQRCRSINGQKMHMGNYMLSLPKCLSKRLHSNIIFITLPYFSPSLSLPLICGMRKHNSGIIIPASRNWRLKALFKLNLYLLVFPEQLLWSAPLLISPKNEWCDT